MRISKATLAAGAGRWAQRPEWLLGFLAAAALLLLVYALNLTVAEPRAASPWGLTYGTLATLLLAGAGSLAARRRTFRSGLGRTQTWVQLHVYGGTLFALLVLMHAGFEWPRSGLNRWLMGLSLWVAASGLAGVAVRKWLPRVLASALTTEVLYERIPELAAVLRRRAEELVAAAPGPVRDLYRRSLAPLLAAPRFRWIYFADVTGGIANRLRELDYLAGRLPAEGRGVLDELRSVVRTKLELDAHYTLQRPLRWWLYAHVPPSLVLLLLVAVHLLAVWYF
ncbi:MAG TPA: hypothetical protein VMR44_02830 [Thermoanaerobaculia bacterium]|nr:hypothetical protein [Thermoanaerobaculia bacterium]